MPVKRTDIVFTESHTTNDSVYQARLILTSQAMYNDMDFLKEYEPVIKDKLESQIMRHLYGRAIDLSSELEYIALSCNSKCYRDGPHDAVWMMQQRIELIANELKDIFKGI